MRKSNCHWHGTFNAEKVYCTSFCIAIHSGRRHGDIMQERTTQSGLPRLFWGWKDTNFTGMWKFLINLVQFSTPYHLFNLVILYSITRAHSHISLFLSLLLLSHFEWWCCRHIKYIAIFQTWILLNARTHIEALSISKLLGLRYGDTRTYCLGCPTTG